MKEIKKRILIIGKDGQLGRCFKDIAVRYVSFSFSFVGRRDVDMADIRSVENLLNREKPDVIVNCAAYTNVEKAQEEKELCFAINQLTPSFISTYAKDNKCKFINFSTDYVFDGDSITPYTEDDKMNALSIYGRSKQEFDEIVLSSDNDNTTIVRTSWLYSPYGKNFVKTMLNIANDKKEIAVVNDQRGCPTSAYDLAEACLTMIEKGLEPGIYNYSNEGDCSWYEFAKEVFSLADIRVNLKPIASSEYPHKAERPRYSVLSKEKIKNKYKINIPDWQTSLREELNRIIQE